MKDRSFDTTSQTEALLNELKGNLFEYLVALNLSRLFHIEAAFIQGFSGHAKQQFVQYESWIREHAPYLLEKLPVLAQKTALAIEKRLKSKVYQISVIGKQMSENAHTKGHDEGDILLDYGQTKKAALSLKLCKANAFVNTKSGGIRSFLEKYFREFPSSGIDQNELNICVDESFQMMGHKLYENTGMSFEGSFDQRWIEAGKSELPGQLNQSEREIVHASYQAIVAKLYDLMKEMYHSQPVLFFSCLQRLMGFSGEALKDTLQVICTYSSDKKDSYKPRNVYISDSDEIQKLENSLSFGELKAGLSSFEIGFADRILQIRIKPMNKFTASAHKVNCSVKLTH